jgi:hypothetical protein
MDLARGACQEISLLPSKVHRRFELFSLNRRSEEQLSLRTRMPVTQEDLSAHV